MVKYGTREFGDFGIKRYFAMVKYATPPSTSSVSVNNCKKKNNADHFEFIIHALEEDIPCFPFLYYLSL